MYNMVLTSCTYLDIQTIVWLLGEICITIECRLCINYNNGTIIHHPSIPLCPWKSKMIIYPAFLPLFLLGGGETYKVSWNDSIAWKQCSVYFSTAPSEHPAVQAISASEAPFPYHPILYSVTPNWISTDSWAWFELLQKTGWSLINLE
jgi:hypothetical protein